MGNGIVQPELLAVSAACRFAIWLFYITKYVIAIMYADNSPALVGRDLKPRVAAFQGKTGPPRSPLCDLCFVCGNSA